MKGAIRMEKIVQQGILYDFYGELLTEHQKQIYEGVVYENMSLAEIADEQGISRQAVHDLIKRTDKILLDYESKLGLVKRFSQIKERLSQMDDDLKIISKDSPDDKAQIESIRSKCKEIIELM